MWERFSLIKYDVHGIIKVQCNVHNIIPTIFEVDRINGNPDLSFFIFLENERLPDSHATQVAYRISIRDLSEYTKVYYSMNRVLNYMHHLLHDTGVPELFYLITNKLMPLKLLQKGYSFVHSACLSYDDEGLLIVAPPDTGKTFTAIILNRSGFSYLSDDMTIVKRNVAYCYPTALTLNPLHIAEFKLPITCREHFNLRIRRIINRIPLLIHGLDGIMVNPERIVHNLSMKTKIRNIYFLDSGPEKVQELDIEVGLKKLMATTYEFKIFEDRHILSYFLKKPYEELNLQKLLEERNRIYGSLTENAKIFNVSTRQKRKYAKLILNHFNKL